MKTRQIGEKYRPVVQVIDEEKGIPTAIQVSGTMYIDVKEYQALKKMYAQTASKLRKSAKDHARKDHELNTARQELKKRGIKVCLLN